MSREVAGATPAPRAKSERLFAITRRDLPVGLRTAQVGHALIEWTLRFGKPPENLVVLAVDDEDKLESWLAMLADHDGKQLVAFHEPDLDDELTAVACGPAYWRDLSSLPLLR